MADSLLGLRVAGSALPACGALQQRELLLFLLKHNQIGQHIWWHLHTDEIVILQTWKVRTTPFAPTGAGTTQFDFLKHFSPLVGRSGGWEDAVALFETRKRSFNQFGFLYGWARAPQKCFQGQQLMLDIYRETVL